MNRYRLDFINDKEFEILSCDLLSSLWNVRIETFKPGRDRGVDGRFYSKRGQEGIVQCKHFEKSGYKKLLAHLKKDELPKIKPLKPARYVLTTSVPLSRADKQEIAALFAPFILRPDDILGHEDIQRLLSKFPIIVQGHYKLWFSGTEVLRLITSAAIIGRSQYTIEEIQQSLPKYVFTDVYAQAVAKLEKQKAIVITGAPGIGKTTLAKQLLLFYLSHGYELIHIAKELSEAEAKITKEKRQIFYFDDFLGRNYLEFLEGSSDSRVMDFVSRICRTPDKRFVLTSRTVILNRAKAISETFSNANIARREFEIVADNLKGIEKAKILYNHISQSSLSARYLREFFVEKRYKKIISHHAYNPRLVEFVTDPQRVNETPSNEYWKYVMSKFDNPVDVWKGVYETQLDKDSRWLLCAVVFNGGEFDEPALQQAYHLAFHGPSSPSIVESRLNFDKALSLACGSVLNRTIDVTSKSTSLSLFNPSIGDFIIHRHASDIDTLTDFTLRLQSIEGLTRLVYISRSKSISAKVLHEILRRLVSAATSTNLDLAFRLRLVGVLIAENLEKTHTAFVDLCLDDIPGFIGVLSTHRALTNDLIELIWFGSFNDKFEGQEDVLKTHIDKLLDKPLNQSELMSLSGIIDRLRTDEDGDVIEKFRTDVVDVLSESIDSLVEEREIIAEYLDYHECKHDAEREVFKYASSLLEDFHISFEDSAAEEIADSCDIRGIIDRNAEAKSDDYRLHPTANRDKTADEEAEIDNLFFGNLATNR